MLLLWVYCVLFADMQFTICRVQFSNLFLFCWECSGIEIDTCADVLLVHFDPSCTDIMLVHFDPSCRDVYVICLYTLTLDG